MPKKILLAEDDFFLAKILKTKLEKEGHEVTSAVNGAECIDFLSKNNKYDLLLLDLIMPVKDGFQVLSYIHSEPKLKTLPIVVASNLSQTEDIDQAIKLGAKDYYVKSEISINDIIQKINKFL